MVTQESIARLEADSEWKPWAEKGWTLHQTPDEGVRAVNLALGRATVGVARLDILLGRLERGAFNYSEFLKFKRLHLP